MRTYRFLNYFEFQAPFLSLSCRRGWAVESCRTNGHQRKGVKSAAGKAKAMMRWGETKEFFPKKLFQIRHQLIRSCDWYVNVVRREHLVTSSSHFIRGIDRRKANEKPFFFFPNVTSLLLVCEWFWWINDLLTPSIQLNTWFIRLNLIHSQVVLLLG